MIAILTPTTYWFGHPPILTLDPGASDTRSRTRRITRTATLDGGAVINDGGYSEADRTMTLAVRGLTQAQAAILEEIAAYPECCLALDHGLYRGQVQNLKLTGGETSTVVFWVSAKLA